MQNVRPFDGKERCQQNATFCHSSETPCWHFKFLFLSKYCISTSWKEETGLFSLHSSSRCYWSGEHIRTIMYVQCIFIAKANMPVRNDLFHSTVILRFHMKYTQSHLWLADKTVHLTYLTPHRVQDSNLRPCYWHKIKWQFNKTDHI